MKLHVYTDGGARGNPGPAAIGVAIYDVHGASADSSHEIALCSKKIGETTNNVAEYSAVQEAHAMLLVIAKEHSIESPIQFFCDSLLVVQQLNGIYRVKLPHLRAFLTRIRILEEQLHIPVQYTHIPREQNRRADALVNKALDA